MTGRSGAGRPDTPPSPRYECKYLVPNDRVEPIRSYIRPFVRLDPFAASRGLVRYAVCSLYLDTDDLRLYRHSLHGLRNRYKLRIRSYSDDPSEPVFLEVKRRVDGIVLKCRAAIDRGCLPRALAGVPGDPDRPRSVHASALSEFAHLALAAGCRPMMRVRYRREAYESRAGDPVRVTFDTDLCHALTPRHDVSLNGRGWRPSPLPETILEVKFTDRFPSWVRDLLRAFDLQRVSLPKYGLSMTRALEEGRYRAPLAAGLARF
jgi:hypothetical protein